MKEVGSVIKEVLDNMGDGIIVLDKNCKIVFANKAVVKLYGQKEEEIMGLECHNLFHQSPLPCHKKDSSIVCPHNEVFKTGKPISTTHTHRLLGGKEGFFDITASPIMDEKGKVIQVVQIVRDITEKQEAQEALKASEEKYRSLVENIEEVIYAVDTIKDPLRGQLFFVSNQIKKITGYSPDEFINNPNLWFESLHPDDLRGIAKDTKKLIKNKKKIIRNYRLRHKTTGKYRWLEDMIMPTIDSNGTVISFLGVARDITERQQIEQIMRDRKEEFRLLFEASCDAIFWADVKTGIIINCNKAAEDLLERQREEIIGQKQTLLHPPHKSEHYTEMFKKHISQKGLVDSDAEVITKSGRIKTVHITATATSVGERQLIQGTFRDITERKQAEEAIKKFKFISDNAVDAHFLLGRDARFSYVNKTACRMFAYPEEEFLKLGVPDVDVIYDLARYQELFDLIQKETIPPLETVNKRKDGSTFPSEITVTGYQIEGKPYIFAALRDISDRKRAEEALRESESKYRALFEQAADAIVLIDAETGALVEFNDKTCENLGYTREEFSELKISDFEVIESAEEVGEHIKKIIKEDSHVFETKHRRKDGKIRDILVNCRAVSLEGKDYIQSIWSDITERRQIEKSLLKEKNLSESIINSLPGIFYLFDDKGKFLQWNKNVEKVTGYSGEEIAKMNALDFFAGEDREAVAERIKETFVKGESIVEANLVSKDGTQTPHFFTGLRMKIDDRPYLVGVGMDIAERKQAEKLLRESELKFKSLAEKSPNMIFINRVGRVVYANKICEEIMGYTIKELLDDEFDFMSLIAEESKDIVKDSFAKHMKGEEVPPYEYKLLTGDGKKIDSLVTTKLIDYEGDRAILGIVTDITERRKVEEALKGSERKYRDLVDNALIGVYKTTLEGKILYVNKALSDMFEFESPEEMMKENVLVRYNDPNDRVVLIKNLMKDGRVANYKVDLLTKTGLIINSILSATMGGDAISGMIMDISELKRAEEAVRESEMFLSSIIEGIKDGVVVLDRNFEIKFANSTYIEQLGKSFNDIRGKHCYEILYDLDEPCYIEEHECGVNKVFETGESIREIRKKGDQHVEITVYPLKDSAGRVLSVVEIRRDVTKNVRLDGELKSRVNELEEFYDMAVGRELKMKELKEQIEGLKKELMKHKN